MNKTLFRSLTDEQCRELLPQGLIFLGYRGSIAHGTHVAPENETGIDDKDLMGVFIAPQEFYFGFDTKDHHERFINEWDAVSYELRKLVRLLLKGNPNVLSLLWLPQEFVIYEDEHGKQLRANKHLFVSKQVYHSFIGYAHGQMHRMTHGNFEGYMGEKRKRLVDQFGFDCKNAAHMIRLLRMGIEFLQTGALQVYRPDAAQLRDIKEGKWSLTEVQAEAEHLFERAKQAYDSSTLPEQPDIAGAEKMLIEMIRSYHA